MTDKEVIKKIKNGEIDYFEILVKNIQKFILIYFKN
jgi:hypothetical protein